ncbi:MAG: RNA pseudouridine synthase [Bacteroidetes bacterium]|nr:RNA pseudouridine synthase [Bacteroidota bacterium]MBS1607368.1 RNA pseudouridine synthase [Bacteroidota bacterium]
MLKVQDILISESEDFIVLNKPSGLLSIPDREGKEISLKVLLLEKYGSIFTVHRLDKDTSGAILFAKNETAHKYFSQQFEERFTRKIYNGLVLGKMEQQQGVIDQPIAEHYAQNGKMMTTSKGKPSVTEYEVLEQFRNYAWVQFNILTGRTHQIRVHMQHIGHPIACDELYGDNTSVLLSSFKKKFKLSKNEEEEKPILSRLALHAAALSVKDIDGTNLEFKAELPKDLKALLQQLRKWNH